jgi:hypothetical protein
MTFLNFELNKLYKIYIFNFFLFLTVIAAICSMFFVQFKSNNLQSKLNKINEEIGYLEDEVKILEIEWVYLTRPERLRILSTKYLENKDIDLSQIKTIDDIKIANGKIEKILAAK